MGTSWRGRDERGEVQIVWVIVAAVFIGLIGAIPFILMQRGEVKQAQTAVGALGQAHDVSVQADLVTAIAAAQTYFAENGTYVGFDATAAAAYDPSIAYNTSPTALAGQVSIRGAAPTTIVLVEKSDSGTVFCVASNGGVVTRGRFDAATGPACTGSW